MNAPSLYSAVVLAKAEWDRNLPDSGRVEATAVELPTKYVVTIHASDISVPGRFEYRKGS